MKRTYFWLFFLSLFLLSTLAHAQPIVNSKIVCNNGTDPVTTNVNAVFAGAANIKIVTGSAGAKIKIMRYSLASDTTAIGIGFTEGTGALCVTGNTVLATTIFTYSAPKQTFDSGTLLPPIITNVVTDDLCLNASAAATITGYIQTCTE